MSEVTDGVAQALDLGRLVRVYKKMKAKRSELKTTWEEQDGDIEKQMKVVKGALLDYCKTNNIDSVRTPDGLFYRTVSTRYWTNDWNAMGAFIVEHNAPDLLEKRLHQGNMKQFLEDHPDVLPPSLNVESEYNITIRSK